MSRLTNANIATGARVGEEKNLAEVCEPEYMWNSLNKDRPEDSTMASRSKGHTIVIAASAITMYHVINERFIDVAKTSRMFTQSVEKVP